MAIQHDERCDQQHTLRQACNQNLAPLRTAPEADALVASAAAPPPGIEPAFDLAIETPPAVPESPVRRGDQPAAAGHDTRVPPAVDPHPATVLDTMPAPSPAAVQAWSETAAAVGATATPAAPVEVTPTEHARPRPSIFLPAAAIALLGLLLLLRRHARQRGNS